MTLRLGTENTGTLVSVALDMVTGLPLPESWCLLSTPAGRMSHGQIRDRNGVVTIPSLAPGVYKVIVSSDGYTVSEHQVEIKAGETVTVQDVLEPAGTLRWTLLDRSGTGVAVRGIFAGA